MSRELCSFLVRTPVSGLGVHPKSRTISLKNPSLRLQRPFCPNKVHLTGSRGQDVDNTWGHPQPPLPSKLTGPHPPPAWGVSRHRRQTRSCVHWPQTPGRPCHVPGTVRGSARPTAQVRTPRGWEVWCTCDGLSEVRRGRRGGGRGSEPLTLGPCAQELPVKSRRGVVPAS